MFRFRFVNPIATNVIGNGHTHPIAASLNVTDSHSMTESTNWLPCSSTLIHMFRELFIKEYVPDEFKSCTVCQRISSSACISSLPKINRFVIAIYNWTRWYRIYSNIGRYKIKLASRMPIAFDVSTQLKMFYLHVQCPLVMSFQLN